MIQVPSVALGSVVFFEVDFGGLEKRSSQSEMSVRGMVMDQYGTFNISNVLPAIRL
jgi:hypothetical protein